VVYVLNFIGGPLDGETALSPLPICWLKKNDPETGKKVLYLCEGNYDDVVRWVDDDTREIDLHYTAVEENGRYHRVDEGH
jgi:hypothetical protein